MSTEKNNTAVGAEPCGVVVVDKPAGMTSFDVVAKMRRAYKTRRVGHTGTLDPMATGVLVVLVGRAAKAAEYVSAGRKVYEAGLRLGVTTDTEDITGEVITTSTDIPPEAEVRDAACGFIGTYMQTPPMYSAKKRDGEKLYELARRGITVEREPVPVEIYAASVGGTERPDEYTLSVSCSGGTYIRTLCADIGARLGCGGCMSSLRRTETGGFGIAEAHTIEEIECEPEKYLRPVDELFRSCRRVALGRDAARRIRCGQKIKVTGGKESERVRLYEGDVFFALGEIADGQARMIKLFVL